MSHDRAEIFNMMADQVEVSARSCLAKGFKEKFESMMEMAAEYRAYALEVEDEDDELPAQPDLFEAHP